MHTFVIIGCGYVGQHLAALEQAQGARVAALARSAASVRHLAALGITPIDGDLDQPASLDPVAQQASRGATVYYLAPPPGEGTQDPRMAAFLAALGQAGPPARVVAISTTSVYGDCHGEWVDESRPLAPATDRARRRADAEARLLAYGADSGVPVLVLRVPGIYGPGRLPAERLRRGLPVLRAAQAPYSNRIHVQDLVRALMAAARVGRPGAVYNVSDGHPTTMTDYFQQVADALGLARPPEVSLEEARGSMSAGMLSYLAESRRLSNRRMREELGVEPLYPTLQEGLRACLAEL